MKQLWNLLDGKKRYVAVICLTISLILRKFNLPIPENLEYIVQSIADISGSLFAAISLITGAIKKKNTK